MSDGKNWANSDDILTGTEERVKRYLEARKAITDFLYNNAFSKSVHISGCIDCPVCGKGASLTYVQYPSGKVDGKCDTEGCVSWRE